MKDPWFYICLAASIAVIVYTVGMIFWEEHKASVSRAACAATCVPSKSVWVDSACWCYQDEETLKKKDTK